MLAMSPENSCESRRGHSVLPVVHGPDSETYAKSMHVEHLRIPVGAGAMHIERVGRGGSPFVLVHGFGTCAFLWRHLAASLAAAGHTAIAVDLLGHGESDRPDDANFSLPAQSDHVTRALAALRIPSAILVGQGIGGLVALLIAAGKRLRVDGVILLSPPNPSDLPGADIRALQRHSALTAMTANTLFGARPALAPFLKASVANSVNMPDLLIARYLAPFVGTDGLAQLLHRAAAVELSLDAQTQLRDVATPVLILEGAVDTGRPAVSWPLLLPNAEITQRLIPDAGRLLPEDGPAAIEDQITSWAEKRALL